MTATNSEYHDKQAALEVVDNGTASNTLVPSSTMSGVKRFYGTKSARKWVYRGFLNQARTDSLELYHWRPKSTPVYSNSNAYPFSLLNKHNSVLTISKEVYEKYLHHEEWNFEMTDTLFKLCGTYDLKFIVIYDRFCTLFPDTKFLLEDLKNRYCYVCNIYNQLSGAKSNENLVYDYELDKKRRICLDKYQNKALHQIEEEEMLINELNRINARKEALKKHIGDIRESQAADNAASSANNLFHPLTTEAAMSDIMTTNNTMKVDESTDKSNDSGTAPSTNTSVNNSLLTQTPTHHKRGRVSGRQSILNQSSTLSTSSSTTPRITNTYNKMLVPFRFPDLKAVGTSLRSQRLKIPPNVGSRKTKALETALIELKIDLLPPPTPEICDLFSELRSEVLMAHEIKHAITTLEFEYQSLRHKFISTFPDAPLPFPTDETESRKPSFEEAEEDKYVDKTKDSQDSSKQDTTTTYS